MTETLELNEQIEDIIKTFFKATSLSYATIVFNYATMSIEKVMPSASDRGHYKVLASHKFDFVDKCFIDFGDGFPRYYFNFDCMMKEIKSWTKARWQLKIKDIMLVNGEVESSLMFVLNECGLQEDIDYKKTLDQILTAQHLHF